MRANLELECSGPMVWKGIAQTALLQRKAPFRKPKGAPSHHIGFIAHYANSRGHCPGRELDIKIAPMEPHRGGKNQRSCPPFQFKEKPQLPAHTVPTTPGKGIAALIVSAPAPTPESGLKSLADIQYTMIKKESGIRHSA